MNNNKNEYDLELDQMETYAQFLDTLASARKAMEHMTDTACYLNFENVKMIQMYYDSLCSLVQGMESLAEGFHSYAGSFDINLHKPNME